MKWFLYNAVFLVGYVLLLPRFLARMARRGGYGPGFLQRFGVYPASVAARLAGHRPVWVHAVSVGEVAVAGKFMRALRAALPDVRFVLTVTTSTGHTVARRELGEGDVLLYFPVDFPWIVRRVVRLLHPAALILAEGELWPNLIRRLARHGIPVAVVNGRLSAASFRGYRRVRWFFRDVANQVSLFLVQSEIDRERLTALGTDPSRVHVVGSAKYDVADAPAGVEAPARAVLRQVGIGDACGLLVGGSTWPGEEAALLDAWRRVRAVRGDVRLVLVPRHAERRNEIETLLKAAGVRYAKRSDPARAPVADAEVLLVDSTGELMGFYAVADVVFVGKSLGDNEGGQNFIEPALLGKPIVVGPHLENFPGVSADFVSANAFVQVPDAEALAGAVQSLYADPAAARALGERARTLVMRQRGVIARGVTLLLPILAPRG